MVGSPQLGVSGVPVVGIIQDSCLITSAVKEDGANPE